MREGHGAGVMQDQKERHMMCWEIMLHLVSHISRYLVGTWYINSWCCDKKTRSPLRDEGLTFTHGLKVPLL